MGRCKRLTDPGAASRVGICAAAKALGVDMRTAGRMRDAGAPFKSDATVDLDELRAWAAVHWEIGRQKGRPPEIDRLAREVVSTQVPAPSPAKRQASSVEVMPELSSEDKEHLGVLLDGDRKALMRLSATVPKELVQKVALVARARQEVADADKRELENRERRGELLEAGEVRALWVERVELVKGHFQSLPGKVATRLAGATGKAYEEVYAILDEELVSLLGSFAAGSPAEAS